MAFQCTPPFYRVCLRQQDLQRLGLFPLQRLIPDVLHQQDVMYWLTGMTGSDWLWLAWLVPGIASHASQTLCIASVLPVTSVIPARCGICQSLLVKPARGSILPVTSSNTSTENLFPK